MYVISVLIYVDNARRTGYHVCNTSLQIVTYTYNGTGEWLIDKVLAPYYR